VRSLHATAMSMIFLSTGAPLRTGYFILVAWQGDG
jgi:hypothetical protein